MTLGERGVTLIKVVVAMALVATMAGVGVHQVTLWLPHFRLTSAARAILIQIRRAKLQAIQQRAVYYVDFDVDGDGNLRTGGCVLWEDWNNNHHRDQVERGETILDFQALPGVYLKPYPQELGGPARGPNDTPIYTGGNDGAMFSGGLNRIKFNPDGTCSAGTIYLHNAKGRTYAIRLRSNGLVRLWRHEGKGWQQW
ncbi:MAG TPA: GspH/FimT family pseudopilin [Syntrophobacteria bacterium]|nr:GspH/FimT family pseudopilin [Syntrophobacteria bacterium]